MRSSYQVLVIVIGAGNTTVNKTKTLVFERILIGTQSVNKIFK